MSHEKNATDMFNAKFLKRTTYNSLITGREIPFGSRAPSRRALFVEELYQRVKQKTSTLKAPEDLNG
jgi:hypothetical protein